MWGEEGARKHKNKRLSQACLHDNLIVFELTRRDWTKIARNTGTWHDTLEIGRKHGREKRLAVDNVRHACRKAQDIAISIIAEGAIYASPPVRQSTKIWCAYQPLNNVFKYPSFGWCTGSLRRVLGIIVSHTCPCQAA